MNILDIKEIYQKKGSEFIDRLFSGDITVYEKLDGNSFGFYKKGERLVFFKKNEKQEISTIDRLITNLYDNPISYIENMSIEIINQIPEGLKFGFEYFPNLKPVNVEYERLPKNNMVLSYIEKGNVKVEDLTSLNFWADTLDVERPAIIFSGKLKEEQKTKMLEFIYSPFEDLKAKYKTESFTVYLLKTLNPELKKTTLNDNLERYIEGVIVKFKVDNATYYAKILDPIYKENLKENDGVSKEGDYNYYLILFDILEFIRLTDVKKYVPKLRVDYDTDYINFICNLFNDFCKTKGNQYLSIEYNLPDYLKPYQFKMNKDIVTNKDTLFWLEKSENYIELFKIMIASFRKKRKRENYIFDSKINFYFNETVDSVRNALTSDTNLNESYLAFDDFVKIYFDGEDSNEVLGYEIEDFLPIYKEQADYKKELDFNFEKYFNQVFVTTKSLEKKNKKKADENKEETILFIDIFSPLNNRHVEFIKEKCSELGRRMTLVHVEFPFKNKWNLLPLVSTQKSLESFKSEMSAFVKDFVVAEDYLINKILPVVSVNSKVVGLYCSTQFLSIVLKQLENNILKNNYMEIDDIEKFAVDKYEEDLALKSKIKNAIMNNDYNSFKNKVPVSVSNLFNEIVASNSYNNF